MTLIASFTVNNFPILLGDLLISGDEDLKSSLNVPTIGDITSIFPKGSGFIPTNLRQKIAIMNENLAVAWAGTRISAQLIIDSLLDETGKKTNWKYEDLYQFFADYDKEYADNVSIIGYSNDGKGIFTFGFGVNEINYHSEKYGLVRLCGSGSKRIRSYLDQVNIPTASRETNPLETAIYNTLVITTYMTGIERTTGSNLIEYYGGGFEILSFVNRRLNKIDDITYLVWIAHQMSDLSWRISFPEICVKYYYQNDTLIIRKAEFKEKNGTLSSYNESFYAIAPIYRNINELKPKNINRSSFNSKFLCNFIIFYPIDGSVRALNRVNYSNNNTHPIKFEDNVDGKIQMYIRSDFIESIPKDAMLNNTMRRTK